MRQLVFALAVAACVAPPASADPFESAQPQLLDVCLQSAGASREGLQQCVGVVANPCIATDGAATSSYVLCWSAEADAWNTHLSRATTRLNETQEARSPSRLAEANKAWSEWRDAECEYWAWEEGGGSGEQVDRARCHARLTADRAISLLTADRP
jgi:uncharacterized protein YecT (DUF1311 family)